MFIDFYAFSWISWISGHTSLQPVPALRPGLDPYILRFEIAGSNPAGLEAWMLVAGRTGMDWKWVAARWEKGS